MKESNENGFINKNYFFKQSKMTFFDALFTSNITNIQLFLY